MTATLQKFKAYGMRCEGATRVHARQIVELHIAAANTDITYDLGTAAGTFWTGAIADTTYGALAGAARTALLTAIAGALNKLHAIHSEVLLTRVKVASGATSTQYTLAVASSMPTLTFVTANAPTAMVLVLEFLLKDGFEPVVADLGAQV